ncbi:hypothetical protein V5799_022136 [Amblyomma americanum]|uniref:Uncharacterized protein n=1 Tax=Amblyomma americanum TaxID=6943 RepID=A0AAQ4FLV0_AMBAM
MSSARVAPTFDPGLKSLRLELGATHEPKVAASVSGLLEAAGGPPAPMEKHRSRKLQQRQPWSPCSLSAALSAQLLEGEKLDPLTETRTHKRPAPGTPFDGATQYVVQFVHILQHRCDLTPRRRLLSGRHQSEDDEDEYAGHLEHLVGIGVDAGHNVIVIRAQRMVSNSAYSPHSHRGEGGHLMLQDHAAARRPRPATDPGITTPEEQLRYLCNVVLASAGRQEWLVCTGADTSNKTSVVRTQRVEALFVRGPHRYHREDGHLALLVLERTAGRLARPAAAVNNPMHLRQFRHLASSQLGQRLKETAHARSSRRAHRTNSLRQISNFNRTCSDPSDPPRKNIACRLFNATCLSLLTTIQDECSWQQEGCKGTQALLLLALKFSLASSKPHK